MDQNELTTVSTALLDEERLRITGILAVEGLSQVQIAARLALQPEAVAAHLEILAGMGLVAEQDGIYRLDVSALNALSKRLIGSQQPKPQPDDFEGDEYERKILRDYMTADGRLRQIPTQHKKLLVILRHLASLFQPGVQYAEKEVNAILRRVHEDTAALRRYMVDEGLLQRDHGVYWLPEN